LRRKVCREVDRYLGSYDPDELLKKRKKNEKQQQRVDSFRELQKSTDLMIIAPLRKIEPEELNHVLRKKKISQSTRHFLCRWLEAAKSQCGRVAVKRRSVSDAGVSMIEMAGSYRKYRQIKKEIDTRGLWKIVEGHSHANHSCRLVTLSDEILSSFREEEDDSFSQE